MKIEHFPGDLNYAWENGDWGSCTAGINAKDATDAIAGNVQLLGTYSNEFIPSKIWNPSDNFDMKYDIVKEKNMNWMSQNSMII
jgi:hypothetical protein